MFYINYVKDGNHFQLTSNIAYNIPEYDPDKNYYQMYWTAFIENQVLLDQLKQRSEERNSYLKGLMSFNQSWYSQSDLEEKREKRK